MKSQSWLPAVACLLSLAACGDECRDGEVQRGGHCEPALQIEGAYVPGAESCDVSIDVSGDSGVQTESLDGVPFRWDVLYRGEYLL